MKVSIIVPFYNVEHYFARCLDSIIQQSYQDLEIILVDDCSPDGSYAIAQEYADKDPRIKIIRHEVNKRQGGARNSGMKQASGAYIWFIDSDDYIFSYDSVERIVKEVEAAKYPDIVGFGVVISRKEGKKEVSLHEVDGSSLIREQREFFAYQLDVDSAKQYSFPMNAYVWSKWYKRSFWQEMKITFLEQVIYEDLILFFTFYLASSYLFLESPHYLYRVRAGSTTDDRLPDDFDQQLIKILEQMKEFYTMHKEQMSFDYYTYRVFNILSYNGFLGGIWRFGMGQSLKQEKQRSQALYEAIRSILADLYAIDPELKDRSWVSRVKAEDILVVKGFLTSMKMEAQQVDGFKMMNGLLQEKKKSKIWKSVVQAMLPFGLLKWILSKRGWQVEIKAGKP